MDGIGYTLIRIYVRKLTPCKTKSAQALKNAGPCSRNLDRNKMTPDSGKNEWVESNRPHLSVVRPAQVALLVGVGRCPGSPGAWIRAEVRFRRDPTSLSSIEL